MNKAGYKIDNVILSESIFKKHSDKRLGKFTNDLSINVEPTVKENKLACDLVVELKMKDEENELIASFKIKYRGLFTHTEETQLQIGYFANINAPAILYPFVREHITNLSLKCGYQAIILPPFNFVQFYEEKVENDKPQS